jgi:hypothetical protein
MNNFNKIINYIFVCSFIALWLFFIFYIFNEMFNRIINHTGDPFPVLTVVVCFAIIIRQTQLNAKFSKIQEWIDK